MSLPNQPDPSSAAFFERKYSDSADPWNFAESEYEQTRYDAIVRALQGQRYRSAFEPGCSIGALSEKLIAVCDRLEAIDFAASAIATARERCPQPQITFRVMGLPERLPLLDFDLIVLSEIGYYFTPDAWAAMVASMVGSCRPGTTFVAAHWLGTSPDHCMHGDQVHAILRSEAKLHLLHEERHAGFRLDRWERRDDRAVAATNS